MSQSIFCAVANYEDLPSDLCNLTHTARPEKAHKDIKVYTYVVNKHKTAQTQRALMHKSMRAQVLK